jgi:hypothetical protein
VSQSTSHFHQILSVAGMDVETDVNAETTNRSTVGKRAADGKLPVEQKLEAMRFKIAFPGGAIDYDSARPAPKSDNPQIQQIVDAIRARSARATAFIYDKDNQPVAVEGIDKIIAEAPEGAGVAVQMELTPDKLKQEAAEALKMFPGKPVKKGDKWEWTQVTNLGAGQTFTFTHYLEYQGSVERDGRTLDKISIFTGDVKYAVAENAGAGFKVTGSDLKIDSSMGTVYFDQELGQVIEMTQNIKITGPLTLSVNGMELPAKLNLAIETSNALKK